MINIYINNNITQKNVTLSNINFAKNNIYIPIYLKNKTLYASILQIII